jgi:hypothetical protein
MAKNNPPEIGVISMVRNDTLFVPRWIKYYGSQVGLENLFLILDGHDQPLPDGHELINVLRVPHREFGRARGDRNRSGIVSCLARSLFHRYDIIIAHDIDEFLVVDPAKKQTLAEYLHRPLFRASLSALGLDVGQHIENEMSIDPTRPLLEQRSFAHVSARYTKAVVALRPLTWGSGFHRVKGRNFHIDPNLYLFHFGMVDYENSRKKADEQSLLKSGWQGHFERRLELFDLILKTTPVNGDDFFVNARRRQTLFRPFFALNKPGMLSEKPIIRIPERFKKIV